MCLVKQDIISSCQTGIPYCVAGIIGEGGGARESEKIPPFFLSLFLAHDPPAMQASDTMANMWHRSAAAERESCFLT